MVFLIRHRLVRQLHTYIYFTLPLSVARPLSTQCHLSTALMHMSLNPAVAAATAAPINNGMLTFGAGGNQLLRRGGGGSHGDLASSVFPSSAASLRDERSEAGDTAVGDTASRLEGGAHAHQGQATVGHHEMDKCCALAMPQDYASDTLYEYIARLVAGHPRDIGNTLFWWVYWQPACIY
ncbi:hypothetical protein SYNPS1DRAFT_22378 [Syncephalis pseudoplumigaleata]|uniref:Uncharacterized protein n=1 Tax=Syncephalis pseudoplumigaleata TaxID=1712513 RepID=A0A4P9Z0A0_9FUNG|nr:hypothetical protein SYNPS1DRAFT_22378 [Syncephalis pseudoplumigaleata]|eukprot:RKP25708.1 hypothetical protein SYNPS1DRAFT_22378 [Syncephalis pseudoplumigaleata]